MEALRDGRERPGTGHRRGPRRGARLAAGRLRAAQHRHRPAALDARRPGPTGRRPALGCLPRPARRTWSTELADEVRGRAAAPDGRCRPGRRTGSGPTPTRWPTSRSGERPCRSPSTTAARPARRSCRRPPPPTSDGSTGASPATTPRRSRNGATCSTRSPRRSAATSSPRCWPNGSPPCRAPASQPTSCSAPPPAAGPLPDEHAAAALWWRMARHLTPAVAAQIGDGSHGEGVTTSWAAQLPEPARRRAGRPHPGQRLVARAGHQHRPRSAARLAARGPAVGRVRALPIDGRDGVDECQALVWRTSIALEPIPDEHEHDDHFDEPPVDLWDGVEPDPAAFVDHPDDVDWPLPHDLEADVDHLVDQPEPDQVDDRRRPAEPVVDEEQDVEWRPDARRLHPRPRRHSARADRRRHPAHVPAGAGVGPLPRHPRAHDRDQRAHAGLLRVPVRRLVGPRLPHRPVRRSTSPGTSTSGPGRRRPGGPTWSTTCAATASPTRRCSPPGSPATARTGRLIDRFRDRVMFPVVHQRRGPRLRRPTPPRPHRRRQGRPEVPQHRRHPAVPQGRPAVRRRRRAPRPRARVPVIVEGPMDAIAVTLASAGRYLGVAPLGTSLTDEQAAQLAAIGRDPIVATDADLAGQVAAERDFWMLTPHGLDPGYARFPDGPGPGRPARPARPRGTHRRPGQRPDAGRPAARRAARQPRPRAGPRGRDAGPRRPAQPRLGAGHQPGARPPPARPAAGAPRPARRGQDVGRRPPQGRPEPSCTTAARSAPASRPRPPKSPAERWAPLARELDPRLVEQGDWPATAAMLQQAHEQGHDVGAATRALVAEAPLGDSPARDLRYRLVRRSDSANTTPNPPTVPPRGSGATRARGKSLALRTQRAAAPAGRPRAQA